MFPPEKGGEGRLQANARLQKMLIPEISRKKYRVGRSVPFLRSRGECFSRSAHLRTLRQSLGATLNQLPLLDGLCYSACASAIGSRDFSRSSFTKRLTERVMRIPQELLDILVCPVCKTPVKMLPDDSALKCQTFRRVYPVRDHIPRILPEASTIATEYPASQPV